MGNTLWFETINGNLVNSCQIAEAVRIVLGKHISCKDFDEIRKVSQYLAGIVKEIENPSIGMFLDKGSKVQAIKFYREKYGCGLVDAKNVIEDMIDNHFERQHFFNRSIDSVVNDYGETRTTKENSIVFRNGWVASIVENTDFPEKNKKYSVAMCDYNGYFNWNILNEYGADNGCFYCDTEEEICKALTVIERL